MLDPTAWPGHGQRQTAEPHAKLSAHCWHCHATKTPTAAGLTRTATKARKQSPENRHQSGLQARLQAATRATAGDVNPEPKQEKTGRRTNVRVQRMAKKRSFLTVRWNDLLGVTLLC